MLKPGDTWTYINTVEIGLNGWRQTRDQISVQRTTSEHIYVETQQSGTTQAPRELIVDADWSRSRSVNGTDTVVNRPLAFPLTVGKTWRSSTASRTRMRGTRRRRTTRITRSSAPTPSP